jgi:hypothetical protein
MLNFAGDVGFGVLSGDIKTAAPQDSGADKRL